jgi:integrase
MARRRYQGGTLSTRGEKWVARVREDVIDAKGKVHRVRRAYVLGSTSKLSEKLARRRFQKLLARVNALDYRPERVAILGEFSDRWEEKVLCQRQPSTIKVAQSHLRCYILPLLGNMRLEQLGPEAVQDFITCISKRLNSKTVLNIVGTLSSMLSTAKEWGYACQGFSWRKLVLPCPGEKKRARFFTEDQARRVIGAAKEPYATMFAVAAMTAIRPGELCGLKIEDLDFTNRLIYIRRSAWYGKLQRPKTTKSQAALPMPEPLAERLRTHLLSLRRPNPQGLVFPSRVGTPMSANNVVQRQLWPALDKLGIPRCGLYAFRHTHSSLLVGMGAPATVAQAQLRHTDARITLGIYSHVLGDAQRKAVEDLARKLDPNGPNQSANSLRIQ